MRPVVSVLSVVLVLGHRTHFVVNQLALLDIDELLG